MLEKLRGELVAIVKYVALFLCQISLVTEPSVSESTCHIGIDD